MKATSVLIELEAREIEELSGKTIVFGLLKRQEDVYTEIVLDASEALL